MDNDSIDSRLASKQKASDRNSIIAFVVGFLLIILGIAIGATSSEAYVSMALFVMILGIVLVAFGVYYRGKIFKPQGGAGNGSASAVQPSSDVAGQIQRLAQLHKDGVLTDDEFTTKKAEILGRL